MDDYFEIRDKLKDLQNNLGLKLEEILKGSGISREMAWFNFNNDRLVMIWNGGNLPMDVLIKLEESFGKVDYIYSTRISENLNIVFKRDDKE